MRRRTAIWLGLTVALLAHSQCFARKKKVAQPTPPGTYGKLLGQIDRDEMAATIADLSALDSRVVGYPGYRKAQDMVYQRFQELGLDDVQKQRFDGPVEFRAADIKGAALAEQLCDASRPVSAFLMQQLPSEARDEISALEEKKAPAKETIDTVVEVLNGLVHGESLYEEDRFAGVELSDETQALLEQDPTDYELAQLNRLLLCEGLPGALVSRQFVVPVPVESKSEIVLEETSMAGGALSDRSGRQLNRLPIRSLWPNLVRTSQTPPEGISGHLIYAGRGEVSHFNGKVVEGSITLLDFNCGGDWFNTLLLGSKAVLFIEPEETVRGEAEAKFLTTPINIPRFWIDRQSAEVIKEQLEAGRTINATVHCQMQWKMVQAVNVVGRIEGNSSEPVEEDSETTFKDEFAVIQAYYDSMSVIPSLAPGAEQSCGLSALFQMVKAFKAAPPRRSLLFLATGAHCLGLEGVRHFIGQYVDAGVDTNEEKEAKKAQRDRFRLFVSLDFSSQTENAGVFYKGHFVDQAEAAIQWQFSDIGKRSRETVYDRVSKLYGLGVEDPLLKAADLKDPTSDERKNLAVALNATDNALSKYLKGKLSPSTRDALRKYQPTEAMSTPLKEALVRDLNALLQGPSLYSRSRFAGVELSAGTTALRQTNPTGDDLLRLNRLLLEEAYSAELAGCTEEEFFVDGVNPLKGKNWRTYLPGKFALSSEIATLAALPGIGIVTVNDSRPRVDTPFDTAEHVQIANVHTQARIASCVLWDVISATDDILDLELDANFVRLSGWMYRFNPDTDYMPQTPVENVLCVARPQSGGGKTLTGVRGDIVTLDDNEGVFEFVGLPLTKAKGGAWTVEGFHPYDGSSLFAKEQLKDARTLLLKIRDAKDPVSQYVKRHLSADTEAGLEEFGGEGAPPKDVVQGVLAAFNEALEHEDLYTEERFAGVPLTSGINRLLEREGLSHKGLKRLNRLLLEAAYPEDIRTGATEGDIVYAPDRGTQGAETYPISIPLDLAEKKLTVVLFRCRGMNIFDMIDQRRFSLLREIHIYDAETEAQPFEYGFSLPVQQPLVSYYEPCAIIFAAEDATIKVTMGASILGLQFVLINATDKEWTGVGFPIAEYPAIRNTPFQVATDMWALDEHRMESFRKFGIENARVDRLHVNAKAFLDEAAQNLEDRAYDHFLTNVRSAWSYEAKAYPDVQATADDVVKGIMFYLALLLPFAFFAERLFFAFPDIRKQIVGASGIFLAVFAVIRFVHPAFEITITPLIVLLAFIILALTVIVSSIVIQKFEEQMRQIKFETGGMHAADVGRLSASAAAFSLGISNMRRRKTRTLLTCTTLILLTFTVLSFTSVVSQTRANRIDLKKKPPYPGVLIRDRSWNGLGEPTTRIVRNEYGHLYNVAPRAWYFSAMVGDQSFVNLQSGTERYAATALVGMTPEEINVVKSLRGALRGRWFGPKDVSACVMPAGSHVFFLTDLEKPDVLAQKLKQADDPVSQYLRGRFSAETRRELDEYGSDEPSKSLTLALLGELNKVTRDADLYDADRFAGVELSPETTELVAAKPSGNFLRRLNRMLLEQTYPDAITHSGSMAEVLGISEAEVLQGEATVTALGVEMPVIGLLDSKRMQRVKDLDNEHLTPVDYLLMQERRREQTEQVTEGELEEYIHLTPDAVLIVPYDLVMNNGGNLRSIAMAFNNYDEVTDNLDHLMERIELNLYAGVRDPKTQKLTTHLCSAVAMTGVKGAGSLFVPILIAGLIVLNTMLGSVYERVHEIGIYSALGLAPVHIAALFIAEACVYAVLGAVAGYVIGQVLSKVIVAYQLAEGLNLNYSSLSAVASTVLIMVVVIFSTLYPARKAAEMSVPDVERRWKLPDPEGDMLQVGLPFTVSGTQAVGINAFLKEYMEAHADYSLGHFSADQVEMGTEPGDLGQRVQLKAMVWLAPYDLGVSEHLSLETVPTEDEWVNEVYITIRRESGDEASWLRTTRNFLNMVRKQFLIWRTLRPELKEQYQQTGEELISSGA